MSRGNVQPNGLRGARGVCAGVQAPQGWGKGLSALLEFSAQGFSGLNDIGLVFLGVLTKGLDKGNQDLIHVRGEILGLFFTGGTGGVATATGKQAAYWPA